MRRLLLAALLVLLVVPTALGGVGGAAVEDGTLSIRDGNGTFVFDVRGSVLGRLTSGRLEVFDRDPDDAREAEVRGAERTREVSEKKTIYHGKKIRFRTVGGRFRTKIRGVGVDVSAVGRGQVILNADDKAEDPGEYSVNLDEYRRIPTKEKTFTLNAETQ